VGRRIEAPDSPRRELYIGNLLVSEFPRRSPQCHLEFFDWGMRLQVMTLFGRRGDCYELRYDELTGVRPIGKMVRQGIQFRADVLPRPLIFITVDFRAILDLLEQHGAPVTRDGMWLTAGTLGEFAVTHRAFVIFFISVAASLSLILLVVGVIPGIIAGQVNFQTLRTDLAKMHLPPGYRLTSERKGGTNCRTGGCWVTQTWIWAPGRGRTQSGACADVNRAMTYVFPDVEPDSPRPPNAACAYFTVLASFFHAGQGKPEVDGIVQTDNSAASGFLVRLVAFYS
jgi:hypothetical protein